MLKEDRSNRVCINKCSTTEKTLRYQQSLKYDGFKIALILMAENAQLFCTLFQYELL